MTGSENFATIKRRPRPGTIALIVLLHIAAIYGLARAFAPDITGTVERSVVSAFTVTVTAPPPEPEPEPDEGSAGDPGREAVPRPVAAPEPPVVIKPQPPAPRVSSTGTADSSGAREQGDGTGAGGTGTGTGSGRGGSGQGSGAVNAAVKIAGDIANVRDYPIPPGGREARIGTSVTIALTVGADGLPKACRIVRPGPFADTNQRTCDLAMQRFRFRPATNAAGEPVQSVYGWKQDFFN